MQVVVIGVNELIEVHVKSKNVQARVLSSKSIRLLAFQFLHNTEIRLKKQTTIRLVS